MAETEIGKKITDTVEKLEGAALAIKELIKAMNQMKRNLIQKKKNNC